MPMFFMEGGLEIEFIIEIFHFQGEKLRIEKNQIMAYIRP